MSKRVLAIVLATCMLSSLTACDVFNGLISNQNKPTEVTTTSEETTTTEATTTEEETTTSEETTTTAAEETASEEATLPEATDPAGKMTATPTPKPAAKPSSIPKGWKKVKQAYGKKYGGKYVYVIMKNYQYKGWYNGKWIKLYDDTYTVADDEDGHIEGVILYRDKNEKYKYCEFQERR